MMTLRLFLQSEPFLQIEERRLEHGELIIGRGEEADWRLPDPTRLLSRRHCSLAVSDGRVILTDLSANGVRIGSNLERAPPLSSVDLRPGESVRLGEYMIVVEADAPAPDQPKVERPRLRPIARASDSPLRTPPGERCPHSVASADEAAALDAFCEGAHLDASAFVDEDPAAVMRRLGAVYREMVLGLTSLMDERTTVKADYRMERTSIRSAGNNPFRWAGAQRIAVDLLREHENGFLSGPQAVEAAFADVKKHLLCVFAGAKAALGDILQALSPRAVEAALTAGDILMKGRAAAAWSQYVARHVACQRDVAEAPPDGLTNREFRAAYGRRLEELEAEETR